MRSKTSARTSSRREPACKMAPGAHQQISATTVGSENDVMACLATGWQRLRERRDLVFLVWLQNLLIVLTTVAGAVLPLALVDFEPVRILAAADLETVQQGVLWLGEEATWRDFVPRSPEMIAALAGLVVLWTLALFVYCWFQAGLYGVLAEQDFHTGDRVDLHRFSKLGWRYLWRFFGLLHAFFLYLTGVLFLGVWVVWLAVWGFMIWGVLAMVAIGLGGMIPVVFLGVMVALWFLLARAEVARPGSSVRAAQRRGWALLRERRGATAVLGALFVALGLIASGLLAPFGLIADRVLETGSAPWWVVRGAIEMASWGLYAALAVFIAAVTVAFVPPLPPKAARAGAPLLVLLAALAFGACVPATPTVRTADEAERGGTVTASEAAETETSERPAEKTSAAPVPDAGLSQPHEPLESATASPATSADDEAPSTALSSVDALQDPVTAPILLRVGLATDLDQASIPCCSPELILAAADRRWAVRTSLRVLPAAGTARQGHFRLQVAALKDEGQARELAAGLGVRSGYPTDFHFDAGVDLYRVRVGQFHNREDAETARGRLEVLGVSGSWVVAEGQEISDPAFVVTRPGQSPNAPDAVRIPGRWLSLTAADGESPLPGLARGIGRYRGRWLLYLNDRGKLNLINEVDLEDYVRSVVPSEMGPELYDRLEALKAQAVAARTYTLRNLGEFRAEGYDICATPRCQVYRGVATEHPLSDRAVAETHGQVLAWQGRLIDARYSATCGGHTEDVRVVFPLEDAPYLRGVPCPEGESLPLAGPAAEGRVFPEGVLHALLPNASRDPRARLEAALRGIAGFVGLPSSHDRLRSLERKEVRRFIAALFDLALDPRMLAPAESVEALVTTPPVGWSEWEVERARKLLDSGLLDLQPRSLGAGEVERVPWALARALDRIEERTVRYLETVDGRLRVRGEDGREELLDVPAEIATFQRRGETVVSGSVDLVSGDPVRLVFWNAGPGEPSRLLAVVHELDPDQAAFRLRSSYAAWSRFKSDAELDQRVATRYPGFDFDDLEVLSRGVSGRVGAMRLSDAKGRQVEVSGLAVRWTLGIPDTRFTARRTTSRDGRRGWLFRGSGWGHGVGLCQIGAVNLAGRGAGYRDILHHYYTGVTLARIRGVPERWTEPTPEIAAPAARARR